MASLEVISVFLASPGDMSDERTAAVDIVERVNRQLGRHLGLRLELYGWEFEAPGHGRAQARINQSLAEARLFVGMLWRRWGTASGDGHTSGFEEEWELTCQRAKGGEDIEVWLFFKDVDPEQKLDAGPELQKVLDFRAKVENDHQALYHTFADTQAWREKLFALLIEFVAKRAQSRTSDEPEKSRPAGETSTLAGGDASLPTDEALGQTADALEAMGRAMRGDDDGQISDGDALRVLLAASQWVSDNHTAETIDTHELNLFYRRRELLKLTLAERTQLVRSMLEVNVVRPGWFWLAGDVAISATKMLVRIALSDRKAAVREAAVRMLHEPSVLVDVSLPETQLIAALLNDTADRVRDAVLEFAARSDSPETLELLRAEHAKPDSPGTTFLPLARILLRQAPDEALTLAAEEGILGRSLEDEYMAAAERFSDEAVALLWDANPETRHLALKLEARRGAVIQAHAEVAAGDDSRNSQLKRLGVDLSLENGWPVAKADFEAVEREDMLPDDESHRRRVLYAATLTDDELRFEANFFIAYAGAYFEALCARHPEEMLPRLRQALVDDFAEYRKQSAAALRELFGKAAETLMKVTRYKARDFAVSSLRAFSELGDDGDVALVQAFVDASEPDVRRAALEAVAKLAPDSAATTAQTIAMSNSSKIDERTHAADLLLRLRPEAAAELAHAEAAAVVRLAVPHLTEEPAQLERLRQLLDDDDDETRATAARRLSVLVEREGLLDVLKAYMDQTTYYYNVASLLDASIHAPDPQRGWYLDGTAPF